MALFGKVKQRAERPKGEPLVNIISKLRDEGASDDNIIKAVIWMTICPVIYVVQNGGGIIS